MFKLFKKILKKENGQGIPEYILILITIVVVAVATLNPVGKELENTGSAVSGVLQEKISEVSEETTN